MTEPKQQVTAFGMPIVLDSTLPPGHGYIAPRPTRRAALTYDDLLGLADFMEASDPTSLPAILRAFVVHRTGGDV